VGSTAASIRIETEDGYSRYEPPELSETVRVDWAVTPEGVRVTNHKRAAGSEDGELLSLPSGASEVDLVVTFVDGSGESITYRQELTIDRRDGRILAHWPPETRVCELSTECGREGTWVGPSESYLDGVSVETNATVS
jgi:hypothetical protein